MNFPCLSASLSTGEKHLEFCVEYWTDQYKGEMDLFKASLAQGNKDNQGLGTSSHKERLGGPRLFSLDKRMLRGILALCVNT